MNPREQQTLDFVRGFITRWGKAPHLCEIGAHVGVSHVTASVIVRKLAALGELSVRPRTPRGIAIAREALEREAASPDLAFSRGFASGRVFGRAEARQ